MRAIARRTVGGGFAPLAVFWALATSWDVLFSPYQPHLHVVIAAFVVLVTWKEPNADAIALEGGLPPREVGRTRR